MKKLTLLASVAITAVLLFSFINAPSTWSLDKGHAKLGFSITHLSVSEVEGSFKIFDATINATNDDFTDATVSLSADASSINTDNEQRDTKWIPLRFERLCPKADISMDPFPIHPVAETADSIGQTPLPAWHPI